MIWQATKRKECYSLKLLILLNGISVRVSGQRLLFMEREGHPKEWHN